MRAVYNLPYTKNIKNNPSAAEFRFGFQTAHARVRFSVAQRKICVLSVSWLSSPLVHTARLNAHARIPHAPQSEGEFDLRVPASRVSRNG